MPSLKLIMVMATMAASQADKSAVGDSQPGCALLQRTTHVGRASPSTEESSEAHGKGLDDAPVMLRRLAKSAILDTESRGASLAQMLQITEGLQQQARNTTKHFNSTQRSILEEVVTTLESSMFSSMDKDHSADQTELSSAVGAVVSANQAIADRLATTGDVGTLRQSTSVLEVAYTGCTSNASSLSTINSTKWSELNSHISSMAATPACASLPTIRTADSVKAFFSSNTYAEWYASQKLSFDAKYGAYMTAHGNLESKNSDCETLKIQLDTEYCAWKLVLEAACSAFDSAYDTTKDHADAVVSSVNNSMTTRIQAFKAGQITIAHVRYLLGFSNFTENIVVGNTSRFTITFPTIPTKRACSLSPLLDPRYSAITCPPPGGGGGGAPVTTPPPTTARPNDPVSGADAAIFVDFSNGFTPQIGPADLFPSLRPGDAERIVDDPTGLQRKVLRIIPGDIVLDAQYFQFGTDDFAIQMEWRRDRNEGNGGAFFMFESVNHGNSILSMWNDYACIYGARPAMHPVCKNTNCCDWSEWHTHKIVRKGGEIIQYIDGVERNRFGKDPTEEFNAELSVIRQSRNYYGWIANFMVFHE